MNNFIGYEELMFIKDTPLGKEIIKNSKNAVNSHDFIHYEYTKRHYLAHGVKSVVGEC